MGTHNRSGQAWSDFLAGTIPCGETVSQPRAGTRTAMYQIASAAAYWLLCWLVGDEGSDFVGGSDSLGGGHAL